MYYCIAIPTSNAGFAGLKRSLFFFLLWADQRGSGRPNRPAHTPRLKMKKTHM